jgi:hypothetical protein
MPAPFVLLCFGIGLLIHVTVSAISGKYQKVSDLFSNVAEHAVAAAIVVAVNAYLEQPNPQSLLVATYVYIGSGVIRFIVYKFKKYDGTNTGSMSGDPTPVPMFDDAGLHQMEQAGRRKRTLDFLLYVRMQLRLMKDDESMQASLMDLDNEITNRWRIVNELPLWDDEVALEYDHVIAQFTGKGLSEDHVVSQLSRLFGQAKAVADAPAPSDDIEATPKPEAEPPPPQASEKRINRPLPYV